MPGLPGRRGEPVTDMAADGMATEVPCGAPDRQQPWRAGSSRGFAWGAATGVIITLLALILAPAADVPDGVSGAGIGAWLDANLGFSVWLFALILGLYLMNLSRLNRLLAHEPDPGLKDIVELDQLLDVWIHLFVGIGVIWTAVGMRSALQAALGDSGQALSDSAGSVLQRLVDGGILLALTTTIVGGVGSYLMRLGKTMTVGARLNAFYDANNRREMCELIAVTRRLEAALVRPHPEAGTPEAPP